MISGPVVCQVDSMEYFSLFNAQNPWQLVSNVDFRDKMASSRYFRFANESAIFRNYVASKHLLGIDPCPLPLNTSTL